MIQRNAYGLVDLPEAIVSYLHQQHLMLDLQGAGLRPADIRSDAYPVEGLEAVYLMSIGNEMHPAVEWRKYFILLHPDMFIQFYVAFNIFDAEEDVSPAVTDRKIYEWQVLIERLIPAPFAPENEPLELQQAKQLLADVIYQVKGIPGNDTANIAGVRVSFRDDEWRAYQVKQASPFVYERFSAEERQCYATRSQGYYVDKSRDISIWVEAAPNGQAHAGGVIDSLASLRIGQKVFKCVVRRANCSTAFSGTPLVIIWDRVISCSPENLHGFAWADILAILKEALCAWGGGYENNSKWHPEFIVKFNF